MRFNILGKFMLCFGVILSLMFCIGAFLVVNIWNINNNYDRLINEKAHARYMITLTNANYNQAAANLISYTVTGNPSDASKYVQAINRAKENLKSIEPLLVKQEEKALYGDFNERAMSYEQYGQQVLNLIKEREDIEGDEREEVQERLMSHIRSNEELFSKLSSSGNTFEFLISDALDKETKMNFDNANNTIQISIVLLALVTILGALIGYLMGWRMVKPIRIVSQEAAKIASNDLTSTEIKIKSKDEIGALADSFNKMLLSLKDMYLTFRRNRAMLPHLQKIFLRVQKIWL
ncbi:hypothetical protein N752_24930 [Desulforamulus aquiferis]|nr:MCP four helix bundle domain-containing protein [Desulforamulus aquiferis]RYD02576.1 hypothetical protein N752_24930 [Desulforamulus aquiferis]